MTTTTSLLAAWCPACDLLLLLLLSTDGIFFIPLCAQRVKIASKHFSIERRRQKNTRARVAVKRTRDGGWGMGVEGKKDALAWGMAFLALVHTESVFSVTLWHFFFAVVASSFIFCSVFT